jgi:hypothetical protein
MNFPRTLHESGILDRFEVFQDDLERTSVTLFFDGETWDTLNDEQQKAIKDVVSIVYERMRGYPIDLPHLNVLRQSLRQEIIRLIQIESSPGVFVK